MTDTSIYMHGVQRRIYGKYRQKRKTDEEYRDIYMQK